MQNNDETVQSVLETFETEMVPIASSKKKMTLIYQIWPGKQRFFCKGRIMRGPSGDWQAYWVIYGLVFVLPTIYIVAFIPYLWENVTPAVPITFILFFLQSAGFLLLTMCADPGIIPRRSAFLAVIGEVPERFAKMNAISYKTGEHSQTIASYSFCETCKIFRPPRAHHCRKCDCCIEVYDHHCSFMNNCVAKKNYQYFVSFLVSVCLLISSALVGIVCLLYTYAAKKLNKDTQAMSDSLRETLGYILGVPCTLLLLALIGFVLFHFYLILTKRTTKEKLKKIDNPPHNKQEKLIQTLWWTYETPFLDFTQQLTPNEANSLTTGRLL